VVGRWPFTPSARSSLRQWLKYANFETFHQFIFLSPSNHGCRSSRRNNHGFVARSFLHRFSSTGLSAADVECPQGFIGWLTKIPRSKPACLRKAGRHSRAPGGARLSTPLWWRSRPSIFGEETVDTCAWRIDSIIPPAPMASTSSKNNNRVILRASQRCQEVFITVSASTYPEYT